MSDSPSELCLEALQCHFTWALSLHHYSMLQLREKLLNISSEESYPWRGPIYNLLGFLQTRLGDSDKALNLFTSASEALKGPALLVNYSNLAWLHHQRGEPAQSQDYLLQVEKLHREHFRGIKHSTVKDHPIDSTVEQLHPEVLAEKAWTLMKLGSQQCQVAIKLFEEALKEQPQRVEWRSSQAIALISALKNETNVDPEVLLKVQKALKEDPKNIYLRAEYLLIRAKSGEIVEEEVAELASSIVENASSGLKLVLRYYRYKDDLDKALFWVEKALEKNSESSYIKRCAALCYKWKAFQKDGESKQRFVEKGVSLLKELILLYPDTSLVMEIDLADLYSKIEYTKAEEMFQTLLQRQWDPPETQLLYNRYAKFLWFTLHDRQRAITYHQRAARIDHDSFYRENSVEGLQKLTRSTLDSVWAEIQKSLLYAHLEGLQCHFNWNLSSSRYMQLRLRDKLLDICPKENNPWRGHIYNLLGFLHTRLGDFDKALNLFTSASEVLQGPALLVNYSNLAWLHNERGESTMSQEYLQRVEELSREYFTGCEHPTEGDPESIKNSLHPEVLAEKAWTLMKMSPQQKRASVILFEQALEKEPQRVEWRSSQAIAFLFAKYKQHPKDVDLGGQKLQRALEKDPENMYLRAEYLLHRAKSRERVKKEARKLASQIVANAYSSYSGLKVILRYYRFMQSEDEAIFWAEKALEKHPDSRYVKRCAALCYKWKVMFSKERAIQHLTEKGISMLKEVISLYPDTALAKKIDLADLFGKIDPAKADEMYQMLLQQHLELPEKQLLYNRYAKFLGYIVHDQRRAIKYHQRAARIDHESFYKKDSVEALQKLTKSSWDSVWAEIKRSFPSARLEELQCHFTWDLGCTQSKWFTVRDRLEDLLSEESNPWMGQMYNLLGFLQTQLGYSDKALNSFTSASEALKGHALLVNYSNLAWLHNKREEPVLSQEYLGRVEELISVCPSVMDHPEVIAEKAFSLTHFNTDHKSLPAELLERALHQEPGRVEWRSAQVLTLLETQKIHSEIDEEMFEKVRLASNKDPENIKLKAEYLSLRMSRGEEVGSDATALAAQFLLCHTKMPKDIKPFLELYRRAVSVDAAMDLAVKALNQCPDSRSLKASLALCYKWKILQREAVSQELIDDAATLFREVISLYPDSCFRTEIDLANIYSKSNHSLADATAIYEELLHRDLEPANRQMLYNKYAKFLKHGKHDCAKSIEYHLLAANIPLKSHFRANSIEILQCAQPTNEQLQKEVDLFLSCLQNS